MGHFDFSRGEQHLHMKLDELHHTMKNSLELQRLSLNKQISEAKLDVLSQQMERSLELQQQNLKTQTEILQSIKGLTEQAHADTNRLAANNALLSLLPKRTYDGGDFIFTGDGSWHARVDSWFKWYLETIFTAHPDSFDTDEKKRVFAVLNLSANMLEGYRFHLKQNNLPDNWETLSAYLGMK